MNFHSIYRLVLSVKLDRSVVLCHGWSRNGVGAFHHRRGLVSSCLLTFFYWHRPVLPAIAVHVPSTANFYICRQGNLFNWINHCWSIRENSANQIQEPYQCYFLRGNCNIWSHHCHHFKRQGIVCSNRFYLGFSNSPLYPHRSPDMQPRL